MKALCKKIFTFFLIGVIFTSTTGFGLIEHACMVSGKKSASVFEKKSCCAKKKNDAANTDNTTIESSNCCETQAHFASIDLAPAVEKVTGFLSPIFFLVTDSLVSFSQAVFMADDAIFSSTDSSPPLAGRELLIRHHSLQI